MDSGYVAVNGLRMYYQVHGERGAQGARRPLLLLHGGLLTIEESFGILLPSLTAGRQVIATELQGHGRTADIERDIEPRLLAGDVAALLDQLGVDQADVLGFSLGGTVAVQLALDHPERVGRLIPVSVSFAADGYHQEIADPKLYATSTRMPTEEDFRQMREAYLAVAPDPGHFEEFWARVGRAANGFKGWTPGELSGITAPTLLVFGDHDFVRLEHAVQVHELIPGAQLAVLPGATHVSVLQRADVIVPLINGFLS